MFADLASLGGRRYRGAAPLIVDPLHRINRGLQAFLPLDEPGGAIAWDASSFRRHAGLVNNRARVSTPHGWAYSVVHPNELANVGGPSSLATSSPVGLAGKTGGMAASIWAYFSGTSLHGALFKIGSTSNGFGLGVGNADVETDGANIVGLYDAVRWINTSVAYATGWHMLTMSISAAGYPSIYYDKKLVYSDTTGAPVAITTGCYLGGYVGVSRFFTGYLSKFRVWDRSVTVRDVEDLYDEPLLGVHSPDMRLFFAPRGASAVSVSLTGIALTASAGTLTAGIGMSPSGSAATTAAGAVISAIGVALIGSALTMSAGSLAYSIGFTLSGSASTASPGSITTGEFRSLSGISMTAVPGNVSVTGGTRWTPQAARAEMIPAALGNTLQPPPRLVGNSEIDTRAIQQWLQTLYDKVVKEGNVLGRVPDHETRIAALEARNAAEDEDT